MYPEQPSTNASPSPLGSSPPQSYMPPRSSKKPLIIIGTIMLILLVVATAGFFLYHQMGNTGVASDKDLPDLPKTDFPKAASLTPQSVAKLNKDDLFWGYFANAAMQQKTVTTSDVTYYDYTQSQGRTRPELRTVVKAGIDYQTKKFVKAEDQYGVDLSVSPENYTSDTVDTQSRCLGVGQPTYIRDAITPPDSYGPWQPFSDSPCTLAGMTAYIGGGLNAGGLTSKEAAAFTGVLRAQKGLVTVDTLELAQKHNKSYLHFTVSVKPTTASDNSEDYVGFGWLDAAFAQTHLSFAKHPYGYMHQVATQDGAHLEYWVDPNTKLPVYSELYNTADYDKQGKPVELTSKSLQKTLYQFDTATFDASTSNNAFLTFNW